MMIKEPKRLTMIIMLSALLMTAICCGRPGHVRENMDKAERLMGSSPDSSLSILSTIQLTALVDVEDKARYALLMSMALDKNYIDTTTFDVLQPAMDYFIENGNPDEKLKTLYYEGVIFLNRNDYDMAMGSFLKADELGNECKDTLTYANMLVSQGKVFAKSYQIEDYINNNLRAARLYKCIGEQRRELNSLIRALDGSISIEDKFRSDSLLSVIDSLIMLYPNCKVDLMPVKMTYAISFQSDSVVNGILESLSGIDSYDDDIKLDIVSAYLHIHEPKKAKVAFDSINPQNLGLNLLRYLSIRPRVLEENKDYQAALEAYKEFHLTLERENAKVFSQKTAVAEEIYNLKIDYLNTLRIKDRQIWFGMCIGLVLCIIIGIIYFQLRIGKKNRIISGQEHFRILLENENLQRQNSVLELEKHNAELELEKKNLASENMQLKISSLEAEGERLKELLEESKLSKSIFEAIQERINILNGLLAAKITDNASYSKPYEKWIDKITEDKKSFMDSTRLAFRASHPAFMKYLDEHGLTESEMNYVCMYAIGLRGKEIGEYIAIKRHYHMSTDIRKKLGLKESDTNLGLYIRVLMGQL